MPPERVGVVPEVPGGVRWTLAEVRLRLNEIIATVMDLAKRGMQ